ncbi:beta-galactosidase [Kribbella qitaiheensis]|uniref:Beta-galactosidase n=1 Tax=Kribbella qitaiheensis TaxID=1544730 RepID=A0A7G6WRQ6_9ACTN|nr:beta-galactosidase [Kribbella qitaiheensis]QNE16671.1 beta-galactosidase [Kribbella qitaiheensis]
MSLDRLDQLTGSELVLAWPPGLRGLAFGGDYNPEQWPEATWHEDIARMGEAGVDLVSVGIFSWAMLEPRPGEFDFSRLDRILELLHAAGIRVDLGTPTAAPPAWLYRAHPGAWVVDADGRRLGPGSRGAMSPSAPAYLDAVARITGALASRYGTHPAVAMWHVHNEYGAPVLECHGEFSAIAFRRWLLDRYGSLDAINEAWGTHFWGQRYGDLDEIRTPAAAASVLNPSQRLDFARFSDHALRQCFVLERDLIRQHSPGLPITTNFMASSCPGINYWAWAQEVDLVANDHYLTAERPDSHVLLAMDADLTRSLAQGNPWMLMEHSTSAVNWQPRNLAKQPGEMARNSLTHLARGADALLFFQWRASRKGAEKFHSAMLPHGGATTRTWREVVDLGQVVETLGEVRGSRSSADVAILWDWESNWAQDLDWRPSVDLGHRERTEAFYQRLWQDKVAVDFAHPAADLSKYKLVIAPQLYLLDQPAADNLDEYVAAGGHLLVSYFSGIVDENDGVHPQGLIGPLGDVLGLTVEEFAPLRAGDSLTVEGLNAHLSGDVWSEQVVPTSDATEVLGRFVDGPVAGGPALTRRRHQNGAAWYVATRFTSDSLATVMSAVYADAGIGPRRDLPADLDLIQRGDYLFLINNSAEPAEVVAQGTELLTGTDHATTITVPAGAVRVLRTS